MYFLLFVLAMLVAVNWYGIHYNLRQSNHLDLFEECETMVYVLVLTLHSFIVTSVLVQMMRGTLD